MFKKSLTILSIASAFYLQAQDVSIIRNSVDVYSANPLSGSAKFNAMAGSMGALGGDLSAINTNPASVGVFITGNISGTLAVNNSKTTSSFSNAANSYKLNNADLGQLGGVAVFETSRNTPWKFVNFGVNYTNTNLEDYIETPRNDSYTFQDEVKDYNSGNMVTGTLTSKGHAYNRTGSLTNLNIALGGNYDNKFYVGASLNFKGSNFEQYDTSRLYLDIDDDTYELNKQGTPYAEDSNGFSFSAGVIGKLNNNFRLGLALESPTWWTINRTFYEVGYEDEYGDPPYIEDRKLSSPMKATISGAFVANKNFALNVDYTLGLSKPKYKVQGTPESDLNSFFNNQFKNLSELKVGGEYRYNNFRLRGGYAIANSPFEKIYGENNFIGKKETLGAGVGFDFKSFYVDAAYNRVKTNSTNVYGDGKYYFENTEIVYNAIPFTSKLEDVKNNVTLTLGWKF